MSETGSAFLEALFSERFPNFACLRCGNGSFLIVSPLARTHFDTEVRDTTALHILSKLKKMENLDAEQIHDDLSPRLADYYYANLVCERCGFSERHFVPILMQMSKTVADSSNGS